MLLNLVLEKTLEIPLDHKEIQPVHPKGNQSWIFIGRLMLKLKLQYFVHLMQKSDSLEKTHLLEDWRLRGEGDDRGCNGWMTSRTGWTWVWVSSRRWWWTGKPDLLQSMGSQRVWHDWVTELILILTEFNYIFINIFSDETDTFMFFCS